MTAPASGPGIPPGIVALWTAIADLNGQPRGKRLTAGEAGKALKGRVKMPLSALNVDIHGNDIAGSPLVFESGDRDGRLAPTGRGLLPMPWLAEPTLLLPTWINTIGGAPFAGDPRHALDAVLARFRARGWEVSAATELEFYLFDDAPQDPLAERLALGGDVYGLRSLEAHDGFFADLHAAAAAMGIAAETVSSEAGPGQFEVTLKHGPAMRAADDTWLFKMLAKGVARQHGKAASFMAKPHEGDSGTGLHVHFSVSDEAGANVFDDGTPAGSELMRSAVAGCLAAMADSTLVFAPHANSYLRLVPGAHAPAGICWAYENRTAALRIPDSPGAARRIEHRVAGGDINPYLLLAAVLGAAILGIEDGLTPPPPLSGNAYDQDLPRLPADWAAAIDRFEASPLIARILPALLIRNLVGTKRQELRRVCKMPPDEQYGLYVDRV